MIWIYAGLAVAGVFTAAHLFLWYLDAKLKRAQRGPKE